MSCQFIVPSLWKIAKFTFFFVFFLCTAVTATAQTWNGEDTLSLDPYIEYSLSGTAADQSGWTEDYAALSRSPHETLYFRTQITNATERNQTLWLSIPFAAVKKLAISAGTENWTTGDALPFDTRPIRNPDYMFPVYIPAGQSTQITGNMQGEILRFSFLLTKPEVVIEQQRAIESRDMFFFGTMSTLVLCCLLCFIATKSNAYLSFAVFTFSTGFLLFRVFGYGFEFVWPGFPSINDATYILGLYATVMSGAWMVNALLSGESDTGKFAKSLYYAAFSLGICGALSSLLLDLQTTLILPLLWAVPIWGLGAVRIVIESNEGSRQARLLALGLIPMACGQFLLILAGLQVIPWGDYVMTWLMTSIALSCLLLALFISGFLVRILQEQRDVERQQFELKAAHADNLEQEVAARTEELRKSNEKLTRLAAIDPLTDLPNRRSLDMFVDRYVTESDAHIAIALLDLDHFKKVNDTYGHDVGDKVLVAVGKLLKPLCTDSAIAGRFGGEEFAYLCTQADHEKMRRQIDGIHQGISELAIEELPELRIKVSIGWVLTKPEESIGESFRRADKALYHAKENGRDQVVEFPVRLVS